jgi:hypothetical protein
MPAATYQKTFVLTVAESKRLIARALKRHPLILNALNRGILAVAKGTTNSYVVEELLEEGIDRTDYCTGVTKPSKGADGAVTANKLPDLVLRDGERLEGVSAVEIASEMGPGDVFVKGANALNYEKRQAGILIGHPTGGTIGSVIGTIVSRRAVLMIPVGLEKNIPGDIHEIYRTMVRAGAEGGGPMLWPVDGEIFTEVEALQLIMSGGSAAPVAAGGIAGAEGSVRMAVWGSSDHIARAEAAVNGVLGEPAFIQA